MKKILFTLVILFIFKISSLPQTVNGWIQVEENNGLNYSVKIQINLQEGNAPVGNFVIRFTYNTSGLYFATNPILNTDYTIHNFNDGQYVSSVTQPSEGIISINIANLTGTGLELTSDYLDVATLFFSIVNPDTTSEIQPILCQFFSPLSSVLWNLGIWESENSGLPVELLNLKALYQNNYILLEWTTASELNNLGFEIERSINFNPWETIGYVPGKINSTLKNDYSYIDRDIKQGKYRYRLRQIDTDGSYNFSEILLMEIQNPKQFTLYQNYPNPFNPETTIKFELPFKCRVSISLFDSIGEEVGILLQDEKESGVHYFRFNAGKLPSGVYFYRITAISSQTQGNVILQETRKMLLLK